MTLTQLYRKWQAWRIRRAVRYIERTTGKLRATRRERRELARYMARILARS